MLALFSPALTMDSDGVMPSFFSLATSAVISLSIFAAILFPSIILLMVHLLVSFIYYTIFIKML